jgi:hypothetical protein
MNSRNDASVIGGETALFAASCVLRSMSATASPGVSPHSA